MRDMAQRDKAKEQRAKGLKEEPKVRQAQRQAQRQALRRQKKRKRSSAAVYGTAVRDF
jgi:hypothetical protein